MRRVADLYHAAAGRGPQRLGFVPGEVEVDHCLWGYEGDEAFEDRGPGRWADAVVYVGEDLGGFYRAAPGFLLCACYLSHDNMVSSW